MGAMALSTWHRSIFGFACLALSWAGAPAHAADAIGKDQGPVDVELPPILAPLVVNGRLDRYAYITIKLAPADRAKVLVIREKIAFIQDAFLRELNRGRIEKAGDPKAVDTDAVKPRLIARMDQILPKGTVADLKFEEIVTAPVNPNAE